ncbi:MAG: hypothetical protein DVB25_07315 [Verrucomicrobia bacterium]|nr:MAG: hypothetical protein DVB25_07315 [Verrucomicrobiota bacterium]
MLPTFRCSYPPQRRLPLPGHRHRGFALVITLALMVLLTLLVVGLLSLSAVSLRTSRQSQDLATAQANARLGMMLALGEVQLALGPDQRVSAAAAAVMATAKQPHLTGAWESWRWDPAKSSAPAYSEKAAKFRRWLVSTPDPSAAKSFSLPADDPAGECIELVGTLSNSNVANSVKAATIPITELKRAGGVAWAVFDESAKASIDMADPAKKPALGEEVASRNAPGRFRADAIDPVKLASLKTPKNLVTLETAVIPAGLPNAPDVRKRFHDFTTGSLGLLTDTANGGLKTDLTSLFEAPGFPSASFQSLTLYSSPSTAAPRWSYLYDHYRKYKALTSASAGTPIYTPTPADLAVTTTGMDPSPLKERLLPVIAKMQIVFSIVSHHAHISDRIAFMDNNGVPKGNQNHAIPHLVYEPVITLLNPYDVELDLKKLRIRVWDPPVGFRFQKIINGNETAGWYRQEMEGGEFQGLARLNIGNEHNTSARRSFTLSLTDGTSQAVGTSLKLQPGEVKVFSSRVESTWCWGFENANEWSPRSFFNWNADANFGNIDARTNNQMGVEAVPGWDLRAGLQTDHMSYSGGRPASTFYDFERLGGGPGGGFVSIKITDQVKVEAKPQRNTGGDTTVPDYQVDVLAGNNADVTKDILRSYRFRFADPVAEISQSPQKPVISRKYLVSDTLQEWNDKSVGGKKAIAMLEMTARTTKDPLDDSKSWIFNNPVVEGGEQKSSLVGAANQSYDVRLIELTGWSSFPTIEWDATKGPGYGRGYFGASRSSNQGVTNVPMDRVAVAPAASLGDLIATNLVASSLLPRVVHPFGNSRAHPLLPAGQVTRALDSAMALDHSYFLNDTLWDRYYFSTVAAYANGVLSSNRSRQDVLKGMLDGSQPALNSRLRPATPPGDASQLASKLDAWSDADRAKKLAGQFAVSGPFNLNSTSTDAWRSVLSSLRDHEVTSWKNRATANADATPFARMALPLAGANDTSANANVLGQIRWAGYRSLSDSQIEKLAAAIVLEIQLCGTGDKAPPLSVGEFVNRRPGPADGLHCLAGILQTAIDKSGLNTANHAKDSKLIDVASIAASRKKGAVNLPAMTGFTGEGAPPMLTQGDLLAGLAPIATVRGDTFKIRAYGEAASSSGVVQARAWCEAVVQRLPEFVDPADPPETLAASLTRPMNQVFGRRFHIVAFRWINPKEF